MNLGLFSFPKRANPVGLVFLGKRVFRSQNAISFAKEMSPDIDEYEYVLENLVQSVGGASGQIYMRFSTDKGVTFDSSSQYVHAIHVWTHAVQSASGGAPGGGMFLGTPDNDAGYGCCGRGTIFVNNRGLYTQIVHHSFARDQNRGANDPQGVIMAGAYRNTRRVNGLQVFLNGGSPIVSGEVRLYGYVKE
jgi:hypothetical protein